MNIDDVRQYFPGVKDKVYLDAAAVGLAPVQATDSVRNFLDLALKGETEDKYRLHEAMDNIRKSATAEAAKLLRSEVKNIALIESTTHGLNIAANSIPFESGDNVLIADTEYLQVAIPWKMKEKTAGIRIKPVFSHDEGVLTPGDFERAIDSKTRAVCVSSVQWCSGYRLDIKTIGEICRDKNIWLVVDAIQEIGAMDVDVSQRHADFIIAGGHKWLISPFGCGVMYLSDRALDELEPDSYGYLATEPPEGGWGEYFMSPDTTPYREYSFQRSAKRFEIAGTSNYPGAAGLGGSLKLFNDIGMKNVENHIRGLADLLRSELDKIGARIVSKREPERSSGITIFNFYDTHEKERKLLAKISTDRIFISIRYTSNVGGLRIAAHMYNNEDDIHKLISSIKKHAK